MILYYFFLNGQYNAKIFDIDIDICLFLFRSKQLVHNVVLTASTMPTFLPGESGEL